MSVQSLRWIVKENCLQVHHCDMEMILFFAWASWMLCLLHDLNLIWQTAVQFLLRKLTLHLFYLIWFDQTANLCTPAREPACFRLPVAGWTFGPLRINLKTCFNCGHVTIMCPKPLDKASFQLFTSDSFWLTFMCPKSRKAMMVMNLTDRFFLLVHDMITW